jgi:hypothetical protein
MHELNGVCLCWLNGAKWSKPACNPGLITLDQIARTHVALCADWTLPVWPVRGTGAARCRPVVCVGWTRPVWPVRGTGAAQSIHLFFALCISCHTHHKFVLVTLTCCTPLILRYRGSSHALSSKFVLLAFEAKFLKFNSKHKLRGRSIYI